MVYPDTASHQNLDGCTSLRGTFQETGSSSSVANPHREASHLSSQPAAGQGQTVDVNGGMSSTPGPTLPTQGIQHWHPSVSWVPQHWCSYYDPTRYRQSFSTPLFSSMSGPHLLPSVVPSGTAPVTDIILRSLWESSRALQSQFTAFQESLGDVKSDIKDALSQLHALHNAHNRTDKCVAELEGVIGVSSTGTASRGRGRCGKGRGRGGRAGARTEPLLGDADAETVPGKTLIQTVTSIQSAVDALLARENCGSHSPFRQEAALVLPPPQSVNSTGRDSCWTSSPPQSLLDPSHQYPTLQLTQSSPTFSKSQSETSPLSSIVNPTPEFGASFHEKKYADASIQACLPSSSFGPSCSLLHSQRHAPGFAPADWNFHSATPGRSSDNLARPTAYTAECLAHLSRDSPSAINAATDSETPPSDNDYPLRDSTTSHTHFPTRTSSLDTLAVPSVGGTSPETEIPSSSTSTLQSSLPPTPSLTIKGDDSLMTGSKLKLSGNAQVPVTSPSSSSNSTDATPISVSGASGSEQHLGCLVQLFAKSHTEDSRMTIDTDGNGVSVTRGTKTVPELIPATLGHRRQSSPGEADDGGLTSGLPTPPSETFADHREPWMSRLTHGHSATTDPALISRVYLPRCFPVITTPPSLSPEPSIGEDRGSGQPGSLGASSVVLSRMIPPPLSPSAAGQSLLSEEGGSDMTTHTAAQKGTEELPASADDARDKIACRGSATKGVGVDAPMNDAISSPGLQTGRAGADGSNSATDLGVPVTAVTHKRQSIVTSNDGSSEVPQGSSVGQPGIELAEHHLDTIDIGPAYFQLDEFGFGFSSPQHRPEASTSTIPSLCATPSDSSGSRPSREEDEVLGALILGESGMSTPVPGSRSHSFMFSQRPSRASSVLPHSWQQFPMSPSTYANDAGVDHASSTSPPELFTVYPPMLHGPTQTLLPHGPKSPNLLPALDTSLPSPTSTGETVVDAPADRFHRSSSTGRSSEPYHAPSFACAAGSTAHDASKAMSVKSDRRSVGGPNASLGELALLARREPLKIHLRLSETMQGVKRKWSVVDDEGERQGGEEEEWTGRVSRRAHPGVSIPVDGASQEGQVPANVLSRRSRTTFAPNPSISRSTSERFTNGGLMGDAREYSDVTSHFPVSGKRRKRQNECDGQEVVRARVREKKRRRALNAKSKSPMKYHVRNGQIVAVQPETVSEPDPTPLPEPFVCVEEASHDSQTATLIRHRKGRENQATEVLLSSPARPNCSSRRGVRCVRSYSTEEEVWNVISQVGGRWPKLPKVFNQWDGQFIQCDNCDMWFHYGCVAIKPADPRLEPTALFICPTCHTQSATRKTLRNHDEICARPDCPEPQVAGEEELYFVEKLVGRKEIKGCVYTWLAKWQGFPMSQASWIPKENVIGDGTKLFDAFLEDAAAESADLSSDVVLLQEAIEAGWEAC